MWKLGRVRLTN